MTTEHDSMTTDELVAMVRETTRVMFEAAHRLQLLTNVLRQRLLESRGGIDDGQADRK